MLERGEVRELHGHADDRLPHIASGKTLRLILQTDALVSWTADDWATTHEVAAKRIDSLDLWFADLPVKKHPAATKIEFTFFWIKAQRWEGRNESVTLGIAK